jgi:hypothetical protein
MKEEEAMEDEGEETGGEKEEEAGRAGENEATAGVKRVKHGSGGIGSGSRESRRN